MNRRRTVDHRRPDPRVEAALQIEPAPTTVTRLIEALRAGDEAALDELFTLFYQELRESAHRQRQRWRGDYTLNTTALVHEAYLKLVGRAHVGVESRAHFLAVAAKAMRHILCDYARDQRTRKRGGGLEALPLDELKLPPERHLSSEEQSATLVALDEALRRLEQVDPRQSRVVECRYFGGMTIEETATALDISPRTVKRDWAVAQAWLYRELNVSYERGA